jgi:hypothetical protein
MNNKHHKAAAGQDGMVTRLNEIVRAHDKLLDWIEDDEHVGEWGVRMSVIVDSDPRSNGRLHLIEVCSVNGVVHQRERRPDAGPTFVCGYADLGKPDGLTFVN